jgi:alpha-D-ribose 1-methylphosphonate 5-triphosphate diphosphatase
MDFVLANARVVAGGEVLRGAVHVRDGGIAAVDSGPHSAGTDLEGDLLIPGLVELHTDNFERHLMPRPKVRWPELAALFGHDAELAAAGITTVFDALGVGDIDPEAMRGQDMAPVLRALESTVRRDMLRAEHRLHIRLELPAPNTRDLFRPFEDHPLVGLISLMDHTPGQRQWEDVAQARIYYCGKKGWPEEKFDRSIADAVTMQQCYALPNRQYFVAYARERGIALASHDDTRLEHVEQAKREGVAISEFPTRVEAAAGARARGMSVVMGAPNVVRGGSHSGNVAAAELARRGLVDALSSDYVPASLLMAAFRLTREAGFSIPQAIATVSLNPARAAGLDDRGVIAPGLRADLVRVSLVEDQPLVRAVWREGRRVL